MKNFLLKRRKSEDSYFNPKILIISIFLGLVFSLFSGYLAFQYMSETKKQRLINLKNLVELARNSVEPTMEQYRSGQLSKGRALNSIRDQLRNMYYSNLSGEHADNYFFMLTQNGTVLVHPYEPNLELSNIWDLKDRSGTFIARNLIEAVQSPEQKGFTHYDYNLPNLSITQRKISYVMAIPEFNALIGTGAYLGDAYQTLFFNVVVAIGFSVAFLLLLIIFTKHSISELKQKNRALQQENSQRKIAEKDLEITKHSIDISSTAAVWVKKNGYLSYVNQAASHLTGYPPRELIHKPIWEIVPQITQNNFQKAWQRLEKKQTVSFETKILHRSSNRIPVDVVTHLHDFEGDQYAFSWLLDDTEKHNSEKERNLLASVVEQSNDNIIITNLDGTIGYVNPAFERNTGFSRPEAIGQNPSILKSEEHSSEFFDHLWKTISNGEIWSGNITSKRKDGTIIEEYATIFPVIDSTGETTNYVAVKRDMTEQVRLEQQLNQAQKMEAIGTLASGIAHDFNNVLSPIVSYAQLLERRLPAEKEKEIHFIKQIINAASRASGLISQILNFSRSQEQGKNVVDVIPTIEETLKLLRSALPSSIQISFLNNAEMTQVLCDPTQIHQVLMNLGINAGHAMQKTGGTLEIKLANFGEKKGHLNLKTGRYLLLTVRDTGAGMLPEVRNRVFEPFFTTKKQGEGTGLGLAVSYRIIKSLNGYIHLYSEPGQGTKFHIYLPVLNSDSQEKVHPQKIVPGGDETILLIDDEDYNVASHSAMLEELGYTSVGFSDSRKALQAFSAEPDKFDLILTDYTMPGLSGVELSHEIKALREEIPVVLISGLSEAIPNDQIEKAGIAKKLAKPIDLTDLATAIRETLDMAQKI